MKLTSLLLFVSTAIFAQKITFNDNFKWCVATSAHQIEGYNYNSDWWLWENIPGNIKNGDTSEYATNHWNMVEEDTKLLTELGVDQYRFSVEWAKIEPKEGVFDEAVLDHYENEIKLLLQNNIEPVVTLQHFTLPIWLADEGGFTAKKIADYFDRYSVKVYERLGKYVTKWITINEPMVTIGAGYVEGIFPPGIQNYDLAADAMAGALRAHAKAYHSLHKIAKDNQRQVSIGLAHHLRSFDPYRKWNPLDRVARFYSEKLFNWALLKTFNTGKLKAKVPFILNKTYKIPEAIGTQDFIGFNYYSRDYIVFDPRSERKVETRKKRKNREYTDLDWEIYPKGILRVLRKINKRFPGMEIYISENGLADADDDQRIKFMQTHLTQINKAIQEGINVSGYCHWSFLDNFEWHEGYEPRFGLYHVNYETFERTPRKSAFYFQKLTKTRTID